MISLCTVTLDRINKYAEILLDSIKRRTTLINEVLIAQPIDPRKKNIGDDKDLHWSERGIDFHKLYYHCKEEMSHSIGLHHAIDNSSKENEYVLFSDPDIFFYPKADEIYLELMNKYDLDLLGVSHHNSTNQAQTFFPYIFNLFAKKSSLPPATWKEDLIKPRDVFIYNLNNPHIPFYDHELTPGKYLVQGPMPGYYHLFPNHDEDNAIYDVSCNLWLWAHEQNLKWISFQTTDCNIYTTKYFRGSIKIKDRLGNRKLIFHAVGSTNERERDWKRFIDAYEESKEEEKE